ncbi:MAG: hypothetical protein KF819_28390 [Labilithrix sp.]|nr:hypothetical protein [Labilithrix sp.]
MRRSWLVSFFIVAASSVACTALLGDFTVGNGEGPGGCDATQKTCSGACVSKEDPNVGCATDGCSPCAPTVNGAPACKAGACSFTCSEGFSDCDGDPRTGCEAKTSTDVSNCGACGTVCGSANTDTPTKCVTGKCEFACKTGFAHCGAEADTGCETNLQTNALHCGACGHSCLGGECAGGKCQPFQLASATRPSGVGVDNTHVYYTFPSVPAIQRVQRDGKCTPAAPCPQDFAGGAVGDPLTSIRGPSAVVSDGSFVWWTNQASGNLGRRAAALPPGAINNFGPAQSTLPGYIVLGGGKIWWTSGFGNIDPAPHVRKADLDGSNVTTVASYATPVATFAGFGQIAADAANIYWASEKSGVFHAAFTDPPCVEGSTCKQYGSVSGPFGIAVDATYVYWTEPASGTVKRAPKAGGQSIPIATGQDNPRGIAVLDTFVYWANTGTGAVSGASIRRAPQVAAVCDGAGCELVAPVPEPDALIAADDGIYWTDNSVAGGVYRLAK